MADQITSDEEDKMVQSSSSYESSDDEYDDHAADGMKKTYKKVKRIITGKGKERNLSLANLSIEDYYTSDSYNFTHQKRGLAIIINNEKFEKKSGMNSRSASDLDAKALEKMFKYLNFTVKLYNNLTAKDMVTKLKKASANISFDHTLADCFACAILSHGDNTIIPTSDDVKTKLDVVYGVDGELVSTQYILDLFNDFSCPELTGKPRLFFIQACRGVKTDEGFKKTVVKDKVPPGPGGDQSDATGKKDVGDRREEQPAETGDAKSETSDAKSETSDAKSETGDAKSETVHSVLGDAETLSKTHPSTSGSQQVSGSGEGLLHVTENAGECSGEESDFDSDCSSESAKAEDRTDADPYSDKIRKTHKVTTLVPAPLFRDFLLVYATPPGYYAWRRKNGTWFIQTLTKEVMKVGKNMNFIKTLTRVSKIVALNFMSFNPKEKSMHAKKQVPCIITMLTKDIFFT